MQKSGRAVSGSSGRCATVLGATSHRFRNALIFSSFLKMTVLGLLATVCYCAAYVVDIPWLRSSLTKRWRRFRPVLWVAGTLFATLLATYWIADEIYPFVN